MIFNKLPVALDIMLCILCVVVFKHFNTEREEEREEEKEEEKEE
tara:strand:+ start:517 stop:648 length:132 start_codon:yes stop_codon:yes gene_type:complete